MVPHRLEHNIFKGLEEPENKVLALRPLELLNGESFFQECLMDSVLIMRILGHCKKVSLTDTTKQDLPSVIQFVLQDMKNEAETEALLADNNIPVPSEFSFDFKLESPFSLCYGFESIPI